MSKPAVVVIGGGLSGVAAALTLAASGNWSVTIVEASERLGGLAGSFENEGRFYPLGYHHILHRDPTLLFFFDRIGALSRVRWRRVKLLFRDRDGFHDLGTAGGFLRFPMGLTDKARFVALMLRAFNKSDWSDWQDRSAEDLVDSWAGPGVREGIFETLARLRFELPCSELSGAWLGARLHYREGSAPLGYIPERNWTEVLCSGLHDLLAGLGITIRLGSPSFRAPLHRPDLRHLRHQRATPPRRVLDQRRDSRLHGEWSVPLELPESHDRRVRGNLRQLRDRLRSTAPSPLVAHQQDSDVRTGAEPQLPQSADSQHTFRNLYFAGNRTFPSILSTGTAMRSGIETGETILREQGMKSDLSAQVERFRLQSMPRG